MHYSLIALNNGHTSADLSELLRALLSARCKYCLLSRNSVFAIVAVINRLWESSCLYQYISCLGSSAHLLTKRIARKTLSSSTVMVTIWLPLKLVLLSDLMHIPSILVFVKKTSNNSCANRLLSKTGTGSFDAFNCCCIKQSMFLISCFVLFPELHQNENKIQDSITIIKLKVMSKSVNNVMLHHVNKMSDFQRYLPLILYSFLNVCQLKDLPLPLNLQHLAKYCHLM